MIPGFATFEGTTRYRGRFPQLAEAGHFRQAEHVPAAGELWCPSIGLGTYLGEPDDRADREYMGAISEALDSGINLLDSAINYRHQRSERNVGEALAKALADGRARRDEVVVCTKAGYLSFDGNLPADPRQYFLNEYVETGVLDPRDLAGGSHCMAPRYLLNQIERSRKNLGLETIDVFYLHNPETQLADVTPDVFRRRVLEAFSALEVLVKDGKIRFYGMATWNAFRVPESARDYIGLEEMSALAREAAGGVEHHFRFVQLPLNLAMPEAFVLANQLCQQKHVSLLQAAARLGIAVVGSASLYQGRLTDGLPGFVREVLGFKTDGENAIQFARSAPGLLTALVGMGQREHVAQNLRPALVPPARADVWEKLFQQNA
jgi:aryl-alcohol dehydrogenase-like predicted oxidoreductase